MVPESGWEPVLEMLDSRFSAILPVYVVKLGHVAGHVAVDWARLGHGFLL